MKTGFIYLTQFGPLVIVEQDGKLIRVGTENSIRWEGIALSETPLIREAHTQLEEYLTGKRKTFSLPIELRGTLFQQKVWQALREIPYGQTRSYRQIAETIGNPKAARAVGGACNKNPLLFMVPCHRVVGSSGALTGFACGLPMKEALLKMEAPE